MHHGAAREIQHVHEAVGRMAIEHAIRPPHPGRSASRTKIAHRPMNQSIAEDFMRSANEAAISAP